jgi:hypothetical protein
MSQYLARLFQICTNYLAPSTLPGLFPATTDTATVAGLAATFGNGAMTNSMDEIEDAACLPVIGSNTFLALRYVGDNAGNRRFDAFRCRGDFGRLDEKGLQWPVLSLDHPGTSYLHGEVFTRG